MSAIERMTITMPAEMAAALRRTVADGDMPRPAKSSARRFATGRARDVERRDLESLREAIQAGLKSGPVIPAEEVFAELRARYAHKG